MCTGDNIGTGAPARGDARSLSGAPFAVLLGSGLGEVADRFSTIGAVSFDAVPGVGEAAVAGHPGEIRHCRFEGGSCLLILGRMHLYEGRAREIDALILFIHGLGIRNLLVMSTAGSLTKTLRPGDLVLADQILDFPFDRPTGAIRRSPPSGRPGPDERGLASASLILDPTLRSTLRRASGLAAIPLGGGVLATCLGPAYETAAEVGALRVAGAALATMSGAPEVKAANALGIKTAAIAVVTNWATGLSRGTLGHAEVIDAGRRAVDKIVPLVVQFAKLI